MRHIHTYSKSASVSCKCPSNTGCFIDEIADSCSVTPGVTAIEYYQRRQNLAALLPKDSVAILAAGDLKYRPGSSAVFYNFYQDPDFLYLTGSPT